MTPHLQPVLAKDCLLVSDGAKAYGALARTLEIGHVGLNTSAGIYAQNGIYHIQNVNSYTSSLKGWMARFKGVATKNLLTLRQSALCAPSSSIASAVPVVL